MKRTLITSHSGCLNTKMNSMEYIKKAMQMNVDIIEVDIRYTENNKVLLNHDELDKENLDGYLSLESLIDVIKPYKNIQLNLDIKELDKFQVLENLIIEKDMLDRAFLSGVKPEMVRELNKKGYKLPMLVNYRLDVERNTEIDYLKELVDDIKTMNVKGVNLHYPRASEELVNIFHEAGIFISVWTVDEEEIMDKMIEIGVDSISTDRVDLLNRKLQIEK
ncbi:glycerophosphodiester phosphodiesterase [Clostridium ganghwense]|uniref:Glycerophosphodiester phosphodiesterase n=1 Tax=Clostridium ganghwense TaxID=312089 RepID=A0ABT4CSX9_9CLOT|nr:glycerophosphodiester phosphodiesterase [Clostridium ganghwense]MCY6371069.1 glycerophosphodiester phosphodiesterase [Clostridium ganghwense]